jgi:hypothetical protein
VPPVLIAFTVALLASLSLTVPVRALALRVGMVDNPAEDNQGREPGTE